MNLKNLYISAGILAILAVITSFLKTTDSAPLQDEREKGPLVDESKLAEAFQVRVTGSDGVVTIEKNDADSNWIVKERHDMPVSYSKLSSQVTSVVDASVQRLVTTNPERIESLGFDSKESISFLDKDGNSIMSIDLGRQTDNGRQFFRYQGEEKAFLASSTFRIDDDADSWLAKKLVEVAQDDIRSIKATLENGETIELNREDKDSDWTSETALEGKVVDDAAVDRAANRFSNMTFTKTAAKDDELVVAAKENSKSFLLGLADGKTLNFTIGQRPEVKVMKEVEVEGDDGEKKMEMQEEVETEAGPVYIFIESSEAEDHVNEYMAKAAFEVGSYQYTSLPESIATLFKDAPEPDPEPSETTTSQEAESDSGSTPTSAESSS